MLHRDLDALATQTFDLLVIGGGICGAAAAWEAQSRGMNAALIERADFCSGSSAKIYKMIHGGSRYLQHLDVPRIRASSRERSAMFRIAPHLNTATPIAIPTYGHGMRGRELLRLGFLAYELLTYGRNDPGADDAHRIPPARTVSRAEMEALFPGLAESQPRHTGGIVFRDGLVHNPARLVLAFLQSAGQAGAVVANYVEATGLDVRRRQVEQVQVRDVRTGASFSIKARSVLNASGPWGGWLIEQLFGQQQTPVTRYSRDACFIVRRRFDHHVGLAISARSRDKDAVLSRQTRHLFLVPWRDQYTIVGTWHQACRRHPDELELSSAELEAFVDEVNSGYAGLISSTDEIQTVNFGLIPYGSGSNDMEDHSYSKRSVFIDHGKTHGVANLATLIGVRYTMGRADAQKAVEFLADRAGYRLPASQTSTRPLVGGDFSDMASLEREISRAIPSAAADVVSDIAKNYGSGYQSVLREASEAPELWAPLKGTTTLAAEVRHACRRECALDLADIVYRRTGIGTADKPRREVVEQTAAIAARELGWERGEVDRQVDLVMELADPVAR